LQELINVTLFRKRIFADVIKLRTLRLLWKMWVGPICYQRRGKSNPHREKACEAGGVDWSIKAMDASSHHHRLQGARNFPPEPLIGTRPC
jgi:hypothetical protein